MAYTYGGYTWVVLPNKQGNPKVFNIYELLVGDGTLQNATFPDTTAKGVEVCSRLQGKRVRIKQVHLRLSTDAYPLWVTYAVYSESSQSVFLAGGEEIVPPYSGTPTSQGVTIPLDVELYWEDTRNWIGCLIEIWTKPAIGNASGLYLHWVVEVLD